MSSFLEVTEDERFERIAKPGQKIQTRMQRERNHLFRRYNEPKLQEMASKQQQLPCLVAKERYKLLVIKLEKRKGKLRLDTEISANGPIHKGWTLAYPAGLLSASNDVDLELRHDAASRGIAKLLEINAMFKAEETLGRMPRYLSAHPVNGYGIELVDATRKTLFIEMKGGVNENDPVMLPLNNVNIGRNSPQRFRLVLVNVKVGKASTPMYVRSIDWGVPGFGDNQITKNLQQLLTAGTETH